MDLKHLFSFIPFLFTLDASAASITDGNKPAPPPNTVIILMDDMDLLPTIVNSIIIKTGIQLWIPVFIKRPLLNSGVTAIN
ncbi:hypothetical protein [Sphingobacterium sp. Ag1]|uniref:hypothetical protein n=1 Tax=Sphingobacterium sp. Ag1 TaxID=1643451 RepID=UPI0012E03286|nr:hypothetical protein [Sphingobacterium sp. Ag1]